MPRYRVALAATLLTISAQATGAQTTGAQAPATAPEQAAPIAAPEPPVRIAVSRRSLAREYLALERAAIDAQGRASDEQNAEANRVFDRATRSFFRGDYPEAIRAIRRARAILQSQSPDARPGEELEFLPDRLYLSLDQHTPLTIAYRRLYAPVPAIDPAPAEGLITLRCGDRPLTATFTPASDGSTRTLRLDPPDLRPGDCRPVASIAAVGFTAELPVIRITPVSLSKRKAALLARLEALPAAPGLGLAMMTCRARVDLLTETPIDTVSATFMLDLARLADDADAELTALEAGRDPYAGRSGDLWCVFDLAGVATPMRLIVPDTLLNGPKPLIIAVHGAGGDENLFAEGYGGGIIQRLANQHRVIVACPAAGLMAPNPGYLDAILKSVKTWHDIDPARVHLIGHSLGGGIVSAWAKARPTEIAGVVSIAGIGSFAGAERLPRVLAVAGELDPLVTSSRTREQAQIARRQGLDVEYRQIDHFGHTLVVGRVLPEAFNWLLNKAAE